MIAVTDIKQIHVQTKKRLSCLCFASADADDLCALVGTKLCFISRAGVPSKISGLNRVRASCASQSSNGAFVALSVKADGIGIWARGTDVVYLLPLPPCIPAILTEENVSGMPRKIMQGLYINDDGQFIILITNDLQVWLKNISQDLSTTVWHQLPADRLGGAHDLRQPHAIDVVFCCNTERGRGCNIAMAVLGTASTNVFLSLRMLEVTFRMSDEKAPFVFDWTMQLLGWQHKGCTTLLTQWDPRGSLIAVVVSNGERGWVIFASPLQSQAAMISLSEYTGLERFAPSAVTWVAGGTLLAVASELGELVLLTRMGVPLLMLGPQGGTAARILHALPASNRLAGLCGHSTRAAVAMYSENSAVIVALPFMSGVDAISSIAGETENDRFVLSTNALSRTQSLLAVWNATVSLTDLYTLRSAEYVANELVKAQNWAAVVHAIHTLPWDIQLRCERIAFNLISDAIENLLAQSQPVIAMYLLSECERALNTRNEQVSVIGMNVLIITVSD